MAKYDDTLSKEWQKRTPHYIYQIRTKFLAYFDTEKNRKKNNFLVWKLQYFSKKI